MDIHTPEELLARRLRWLMFFRVVTTTFLLGTTIMVQFREVGGDVDAGLSALYILIGSIYFLTFVYAVLLPRLATETNQAYIQILGDVLITSGVIFLTGGLESAFSFMYILAILNGGILLRLKGALITASTSALIYCALLIAHYNGFISPYLTRFSFFDYYRATDILNTILANTGAFYLVALLVGYLSRQAEESRIKLAQRQIDLERLEDLSENIIQSIDSGLATLGPRGDILSFNSAAEEITGLTFGQVQGRPYTMVFPGLSLPEEGKSEPRLTQGWEWYYVHEDGRELCLDMNVLTLRDRSGGSLGRLLVFQDRTPIRQMEAEVKKIERLAAIGELAAGIAHEIRNPLASMSGSFQMLEEGRLEADERQRLMDIIRREMDRLNHIVTDFLLFARPRAATGEPMDLSRTVEDVLKMWEHQSGFDGRITVERRMRPKIWINFNRQQMEQVMWNLLHNAAESMAARGRITVSVDGDPHQSEKARLTVSDTGSGIDSRDLPRIFDPFFTTKSGGSGLGLAIVYRIIEGGGGRIEVTSAPGRGTTFTVTLTRVKPG